MNNRIVLALALIGLTLVLGVFAGSAHAQASDPVTEQIRHGIALREAGDDASALLEFQHAFDQSHRPLAVAQMGLAEQALGHWTDAEAHLRAALAAQGDTWIDRHRDALQAAYAVILQHTAPPTEAQPSRPVAALSPAPSPAPQVSSTRSNTLPLGLAAGAVVLLGAGVAGAIARESIAQSYNRTCRGIGDPTPSNGCLESAWVGSANGAGALAATGLITGGLLAIVAAIVFVRPASEHSHQQARIWCGSGPGDLGIACGGSL